MRRLAKFLTPFLLIPLLAGCVRLEGEITVADTGLVNGKITYALDKSLASQGGINTLDDLKKNANKENENKVCASENYLETAKELIFECTFNNSTLTDADLRVQKSGNQVIFQFNQSGGDSTIDLGKTTLLVNFPGPIAAIKESKPGVTIQRSGTSALISASGTASFQVTITSNISLINSDAAAAEISAKAAARFAEQSALWAKLQAGSKVLMQNKSNYIYCQPLLATPVPAIEPLATYTQRADVWSSRIAPCLAALNQSTASPTPTPTPSSSMNPIGRSAETIKAQYAAYKTKSDKSYKELADMRTACPAIIKYTNGMAAPMDPKFTGDSAGDSALLTKYQQDVNNFVTVIDAKIKPVFAGPECSKKSGQKSASSAAASEEEVIAGDEIADYEISAKYLGTTGTRISIVASPNTSVSVIASKKGVKKKISFKVTTDDNGEKSFRTPTNLKGYEVKLIENGEEVANTSVK